MLSELSECPEYKYEYYDGTGVNDINGGSDSNSGGDKNTDAGVGSAEWLKFLILRAQTEPFGAREKPKNPR